MSLTSLEGHRMQHELQAHPVLLFLPLLLSVHSNPCTETKNHPVRNILLVGNAVASSALNLLLIGFGGNTGVFFKDVAKIRCVLKTDTLRNFKYFQVAFLNELFCKRDLLSGDRVHDCFAGFLAKVPAEIPCADMDGSC